MSNRTTTLNNLTDWVKQLMAEAKEDSNLLIDWFNDTKDKPYSIIGGWQKGFSRQYDDLLYISKSEPTYAMCIKIVENKGPYAYADFEILNMPLDANGEVEDTRVALELTDDPEEVAAFFLMELERINAEHGV